MVMVATIGCSDDDGDGSGAATNDTGTAMDADSSGGETTDASPDTAPMPDTAMADTQGAAEDTSMDTTPSDTTAPDTAMADTAEDTDPCPEVMCTESTRKTGCRCVPLYDRSCTDSSECDPEETCQERDGVQLCWYEPAPVRACPGSAGCETADGMLWAGASSRIITPNGFETATEVGLGGGNTISFGPGQLEGNWNDCGLDGLCPEDPNYPGPDEGEADGIPQGMWIAGFSSGRPAQYCPQELIGCPMLECCTSQWAHDDLKAQVAVLRQGDVTVAMVTLTNGIGTFVAVERRHKQQIHIVHL
ncbi:MAG: hypothetical protein AAFX99_10585, partial [Myxococcota bacterium]